MSKKKKKNKKVMSYMIPIIIGILFIGICIFCFINTTAISKKSSQVTLEIKEGSTIKDVTTILKDEDLIRNELFFLVYVKINKVSNIKAGNYILNKNMDLKEITELLQSGSNIKEKEITITFNEGKTMRVMADIIDKKTTNSYEDVFNLLSDKEYIKSLINEYWFLDDSILDANIYYPLEGYLAPDTYNFEVNASVKDIFKKLLDQTSVILSQYKSLIDSSNYSIHQVLTLASMIESEGVSLEDRKNIAGVFINRLNKGMSLGSDVTTYYASKIELGERDLYMSEINSSNPYNTRSSANAGKLPIGPICNPSKSSIEAALNYTPNNYLYFVADKNMKVYFNETDSGHNKTINELKSSGLWYEY
ncbi:MAG: endolytic transglycosylase MltG [Bacilli bacterium]|nr:endolytic transglycosylase MltG [Bacilli bacterium]